MKIYSSYPQFTDEDKAILHEVIDTGWLTEGKYCRKFAKELCKVAGTKHALLVNSGSSANFVAIRTLLDFFPGKFILTCATGFPTTVSPIYQHGAIPIYVDIDPETLSPNIGQIAYMVDKHGDEIAGAIFTHTLGFPFDEALVREILGTDKFFIVDNCDALGAFVRGQPVGSWADMSTYSFFPAHHITMGEGGAITTNDDKYLKAAKQYTSWGKDCYCLPGQDGVCGKRFGYEWDKLPEGWDHKYTFTKLGYNLQVTEFQGALGYSQILRLDEIVYKRKLNFGLLLAGLIKFRPYVEFPIWKSIQDIASPFGFPIILKDEFKILINPMIQYLEKKGIATRRMFGGNLLRQPAFQNLPYVTVPDLHGANIMLERTFWIGCWAGMTNEMIDYMAETFDDFFKGRSLY